MAFGTSLLGSIVVLSATLAPILKAWTFAGLPRFLLGAKVPLLCKGFDTSEPTLPTLSPDAPSSAILSKRKYVLCNYLCFPASLLSSLHAATLLTACET